MVACFLCGQLGAVSAFAQTLRRYTSLNHLAQAARAVLQNTSQINQMLTDLNRVDFANVQVSCPQPFTLWLLAMSGLLAPGLPLAHLMVLELDHRKCAVALERI